MKYVIGIDLGTSALKTSLFDEQGKRISSALQEYPMSQPHNGWAEQDPEDWIMAAFATMRYTVEKAAATGVKPADIVSIGLSGQMHGLVMLDKDNQLLRPCILWCDQRTGKECEELTKQIGYETLIRITANPALTGFTASKILWVKKNEPELFERCAHILLPKDYLRFQLTGTFATDVSDASGMQLLDVPKRRWSNLMIESLGLSRDMLPDLYESVEITGTLTGEASEKTGIPVDTPVVAGAGDNAAAAIGTGVVTAGQAFTTIGTSGVVFAHTDWPVIDPKGRVHTFCCAVPDCWHVMGVTQAAGLSLNWFRREFCEGESYQEMDEEARNVPIGSDRLLYLPYLMGERTPHLDPYCRGVFFGASASHTRAHFIRAVMEGVTYSLEDCLEVLHEMEIEPQRMFATGGGAVSNLWREMICDVFNIPVFRTTSKEGAALGAAILAAVGARLYLSVQEACDSMVHILEEFNVPDKSRHICYQPYYDIYKNLYPSLKGQFRDLARIK